MKKAQLQITIINAVIASLSTLNIKQEGIICIQSNIIILLVLTFVSFRNNQQSNVVVNVFERASNVYFFIEKMLKIPTISEAVNQRGTCNPIANKLKKQKTKPNERQ